MTTPHETSAVDQMFDAIDDKKYSIAAFKLCQAIQFAQEARPEDALLAREAAPVHQGRA